MARKKSFVMAGLEPGTQWPRVDGRDSIAGDLGLESLLARTGVRTLGGRVGPGHDGSK